MGNTDPIPNSFTSKYNPWALAFNVTYLHKYSHSFGNFTDFLIQFLLKDINSNHDNTNYNSSSLTYQYNIWSNVAVSQLATSQLPEPWVVPGLGSASQS